MGTEVADFFKVHSFENCITSKKKEMDYTHADRASLKQWKDFQIVMGLNANDETAKVEAFKIINEFLSDRTTLGGNRITEADRDMFEAIFKSYSTLTYADKEAFLNVSRWICFLQN